MINSEERIYRELFHNKTANIYCSGSSASGAENTAPESQDSAAPQVTITPQVSATSQRVRLVFVTETSVTNRMYDIEQLPQHVDI